MGGIGYIKFKESDDFEKDASVIESYLMNILLKKKEILIVLQKDKELNVKISQFD